MPTNREVALVGRESLGGPYVVLTFRHPEVAAHARGGQFVMIKAGTSAEPPLRRPFSILRRRGQEDTFSLFIKSVGPGSSALCRMAVGDVAQCLGPLGRPFTPPPPDAEALLVAGGYGVAPFRLFLDALPEGRGRRRLFYGGRTAADLPMRDAFADLGPDLVLTTDDGSAGEHGRVTAPVARALDEAKGPVRLYACGPEAMLHAVAELGTRRRVPVEVSLDPWMGCGVGTCLGCVVSIQAADAPRPKYRCACTEGPVFDGSTVVWPGDSASWARQQREATA